MEFAEYSKPKRSHSLRLIFLGATVVSLLGALHYLAPARADLWLQVLFQALHAPVFGIIAVCLLAMTPSSWHSKARLIVALSATFLLALFSEAIQIPVASRSASLGDVIIDMVGALAFVSAAIVLSPSFHVPAGRGRWLILFAVVLLIWPLKPLANISVAYWERYEQLPSIAPFNSPNSRLFFLTRNAQALLANPDPDTRAAWEFRFDKTGSSSIDFHDPWSNWTPYRALVLDVEHLGYEPLRLVIRVHDETHLRGDQPHEDRFNLKLEFVPGRQEIRIDLADVAQAPVGRAMDMSRIDGVVIFGSAEEAGGRFIIHDIRLE